MPFSASGDTAPGGAPAGTASDDIRVVDLLDTTFDLGALGIAPVATPFLDRTFAEVVFIPENLSWQERTKAIGEAVGRGPQAEELVAKAQRSIDELGTLVQQSGVAGATVSPMRLDVPSFGVLALIPPSIGSNIIADVGLAQPAAQATNPPRLGGVADYYALTEVSLENLTEHNADVIIALVRGGADPTAAVNDNALWKSMSAVQVGRVMEAPWLVWALNSATGVQQITSDLTEATELLLQQ